MNIKDLVKLTRSEMTEIYNNSNIDPVENIRFEKRAASSFSASRKEKRYLITDKLFPNGYHTYDLHSAGIAIQRLMNTGEFDPDYDIKEEIQDITDAPIDFIKAILVKSQYHSDRENVRGSVERNYPDKDLSQFDEVYDAFISIIGPNHGDTSLYGTEAEIELLTCLALRGMGYHTANVFDCFYSEANEEIIKDTLTKVAKAYYVQKKNKLQERIQSLREASLHTLHLEDSILKGPESIDNMIKFFNYIFSTLEGSYTGNNPPMSQKIDGGPVISVWTSFPELPGPGCAGKGLFNKTPIYYTTHEEIDAEDKPEGYKEKLHYVLEFALQKCIPPNQIWTGDMLFSKGDAQDYEENGEKFTYVKPVTIAYAAPYDSDLARKFRTCDIGAVFHTRYKNSLTNKSNDVSISELVNVPEWAFIKDAQIKDLSGKVSFTKNESEVIRKEINTLQVLSDNLKNNNQYSELVKNTSFIDFYVMTLQNNKVDRQSEIDAEKFVDELNDWIDLKIDKEKLKINDLKTEKGRETKAAALRTTHNELRNIVETNKDLIYDIAYALKIATDIKNEFVKKMNQANDWITKYETADGFHDTAGEGFIASDEDINFVKLVDRSAFSFFARNPNVIKGGAHSSSKIKENKEKTAVVCFGRMNPVSVGHIKLAKEIKHIADENNGDAFVYLSHSYDGVDSKKYKPGKVRNPLKYEDKIIFVKDAIGDIVTVVESDLNGTFEVYSDLYRKGYDNLIIVCGADRLEIFKRDALKHNGQEDPEPKRYFNFKSIKALSAGERNEDSDDPEEQASASLLRKAVLNEDFETFKLYSGSKNYVEQIFDLLNYEMVVNKENLVESFHLQEKIKDFSKEVSEILNNEYKVTCQSKGHNVFYKDGKPIGQEDIDKIKNIVTTEGHEILETPEADKKAFLSFNLNKNKITLRVSDQTAPGTAKPPVGVNVNVKLVTVLQEALCGLLLNNYFVSEEQKGKFLLDYKSRKKDFIQILPEKEYKESFLFKPTVGTVSKLELNMPEEEKFNISNYSLDLKRNTWFRSLLNMTSNKVINQIKSLKFDNDVELSNYIVLHENIKEFNNEAKAIFSNPPGESLKDSFNPSDIFFASPVLWHNGGEIIRNIIGDVQNIQLKFNSTTGKVKQTEIWNQFLKNIRGDNFFTIFERLPKKERIKLYTELLRKGLLIGISLKQVLQRDGNVFQIISTNSPYLDEEKALVVKYGFTDDFTDWTFSRIEVSSSGEGSNIYLKGHWRSNKHSLEDIHFQPNSTNDFDDIGVQLNLNGLNILEAIPYKTKDNARYGKGTENLTYFGLLEKPIESIANLYKNIDYNNLIIDLSNKCNNITFLKRDNTKSFKNIIYLLHYLMIYNPKNIKVTPNVNLMYNLSKLFSLCAKYHLSSKKNGKFISNNEDKIAEYLKIS